MKISIESYGKKYSIETENDDLTSTDVVEHLFDLLVSVGYHHDSVKESFADVVEENE